MRASLVTVIAVLTGFLGVATADAAGQAYPRDERHRFMRICASATPQSICSCALLQFEARMSWPDYALLDDAYTRGRSPPSRLQRIADQVFDHCITTTAY